VQLAQQRPPFLQLDVEIRFSFLRLVDGSLIAHAGEVVRAPFKGPSLMNRIVSHPTMLLSG